MLKVNGKVVEIGHFPDGTLLIKGIDLNGNGEIEWKFESNEELVALQFLVAHLRDVGFNRLTLEMLYIPNARQDRVKSNADVFTLKYFAQIINGLKFDRVIVLDPHSKVSKELINYTDSLTPKDYVNHVMDEIALNKESDIVFYPDAGAKDRYDGMIGHQCAYGEKVRDWETGEIKGLDVKGVIPTEPFNVLIVDDICSYGGTFYHSAKKLKELGANKIYLFISHCENSVLAGELLKGDLIEKVYTTNSLYTGKHEKVVVLD